jgi:hypothetical protein
MMACPFLIPQKSTRDGSEFVRCSLKNMPVCIHHESKSYTECSAITVLKALRCSKCGEPVLKEIV